MTRTTHLRPPWRDAAIDEMNTWSEHHRDEVYFPDVDDLDGLPEGWTVLSVMSTPEGVLSFIEGAALVRREAGGWVMVEDFPTMGMRGVLRTGATLSAMHAACSTDIQAGRATAAWWHLVANLCRDALVGLYDLDDPAERAEAALLALGGPLRVPPAADQSWGDAYT